MTRSKLSSSISDESLDAVSRDDGDVSPGLERGAHVVQDVRLVVHHEHAEPARGRVLGEIGWRDRRRHWPAAAAP